MRLLILTFYFEPDLCAGSFRMSALVKQLQKQLNPDDQVDILTTFPNRYASFSTDCPETQTIGSNIFIRRIALPSHQSGFTDQARAFAVFFFNVLLHCRKKDYTAVFATSSRLFTGFSGALVSRWKKIGFYLDIRDIFTDTMDSLLTGKTTRLTLPVFKWIERFTFQQAKRINMVSKGFLSDIRSAAPESDVAFFPNGIDEIFLTTDFTTPPRNQEDPVIITYAGNIGKGQGLEHIIPGMAKALGPDYLIRIVGDGGTRLMLEEKIKENQLENVQIFRPVDRNRLIEFYRQSSFLFMHLNDFPAFKKVLPSKIFEYAATGKPIIAGVSGYSAEFLNTHLPDSIVFKPCSSDDFITRFNGSSAPGQPSPDFIRRFNRDAIMTDFVKDILEVTRQEK